MISIGGPFEELEWKLGSKDSEGSEARRRFDVRLCEVDRRTDRANERKLGRGRMSCLLREEITNGKGWTVLLETGAWSGLRIRWG